MLLFGQGLSFLNETAMLLHLSQTSTLSRARLPPGKHSLPVSVWWNFPEADPVRSGHFMFPFLPPSNHTVGPTDCFKACFELTRGQLCVASNLIHFCPSPDAPEYVTGSHLRSLSSEQKARTRRLGREFHLASLLPMHYLSSLLGELAWEFPSESQPASALHAVPMGNVGYLREFHPFSLDNETW